MIYGSEIFKNNFERLEEVVINNYVSQKNRWILFGCQLSTMFKYFCWRVQHNPSPSRHSEFMSERHSMIVALWLSNCINKFYVNGGVVARNKITLLNKFVLDLSWYKSGELIVQTRASGKIKLTSNVRLWWGYHKGNKITFHLYLPDPIVLIFS